METVFLYVVLGIYAPCIFLINISGGIFRSLKDKVILIGSVCLNLIVSLVIIINNYTLMNKVIPLSFAVICLGNQLFLLLRFKVDPDNIVSK